MERSEYKNIKEEFMDFAASLAEFHRAFAGTDGFTSGCRVLFLIQRARDGGHTNNSKLRAYITRNQEEWIIALAKLLQEKAEYPDLPLRIYQTLNARDIEKGIRHFKGAMLDADYYDTEQRQWFYLDVRNRIISALMKPQSKAQSYFLFDVDTKDGDSLWAFEISISLRTEIVHKYETKNGWHIITMPYNYTKMVLPPYVELKKDAMMLLAY